MSELKELAKELCDKSGCHHKCHDTKDCVVEDEAELLISNKLRCIDCIHNEICQFYNALGTKVICYPCGFYEAKEVIANSATTKEKQIEVLKGDICIAADYCYGACDECNLGDLAESLYNAGYRKQSENTVELPCKVGTTLYFLYNSPYADKPDLTPRIYKTTDWYFEVDKTGIVINTSDIHSFNKKYDYYLGETAFLTKQEAEQALAKMKGGEKQ